MGSEFEDPKPPEDFWEHLPPSLREQVVNLLVEVAYEVISARAVIMAEGGNDDDPTQAEG